MRGAPPSSQPPLLGAGPLRTGRDSFPASGSGPANASFRETRWWNGKTLAVNPVVALWMKQDAVVCTRGTTLHARDAVMKTPSRDPSDFHIAHGAEATLQVPEKAKCSRTPKRFRHMIAFAFFEVGFIGRIVRVNFAFDFNVSSNGYVTSGQQSHCVQYAGAVARFPEESPVVLSLPLKIFLFEPA